MQILLINPNSDLNTNHLMEEKVKRFVKGLYKVDCVSLENTPKLISTYEDHIYAAPEMMEIIRKGNDKYDAFVVACFADPNLDALIELTDKPVVGIAEAAIKVASMMGNSFAIISPSKQSISKKLAQTRKYHCNDLLKTVLVSKSNDEKDLLYAARRAVEEYNVDVIVLGCANYTLTDKYIEQQLGVTVLDGIPCALILASGLALYKEYKAN